MRSQQGKTWTVEVKMMKYDFLSRQQNLTMQSIFADESGTDSQVKMPGTPDCLFQANPFTCAGYRHVSFEECRKYKFLYFRHSCFPQPSDQAGNSWYKGGSARSKP